MPLWLSPLVALLTALPGILLVTATVLFAFGVIRVLLANQAVMFQAVLAGLMLAFLWYLYMKLPHFLRRLLSKLFTRSDSRSDRGTHGD
jgi:hypothetical protein